jgi:hypothetical protein
VTPADDRPSAEILPFRGGTENGANGNGALHGSPLADSQEEPKAPAWSTRGEAPGPNGCWALNKAGKPCSSFGRKDGDYCNAHSGLGLAADPKGHSRIGVQRSAENRRRRAELRLAIGIPRLNTPRGVLAAEAYLSAERIAGRVVGAILDPQTPPVQAARLGLDLVNAVDPPMTATLTQEVPTDPDGVSKLSFSQLMAVGQQLGVTPPLLDATNGSTEPLSE